MYLDWCHCCWTLPILLLIYPTSVLGQEGPAHYCDYLSSHRSLVCYCARYKLDLNSLSTLLTPYSSSPVESLVVQSCQTVSVYNLSTVGLQHTLYQIRLESVDRVEMWQGQLPTQGLDLSVRGSREGVWLGGAWKGEHMDTGWRLSVRDSGRLEVAGMEIRELKLVLRTKGVKEVVLRGLVLEGTISRNSLEFENSGRVKLENWEVREVEDGAVVVGKVDRVQVTNCPNIKSSSFQLLSNSTKLTVSHSLPSTSALVGTVTTTIAATGGVLFILGLVLLLIVYRRKRLHGQREKYSQGETDML